MSPARRTVVATRVDVGERIDLVLRRHLADLGSATRTRVQAWIAHGSVAVNGRPVHRAAARAALGDVIEVWLPDRISRVAGARERDGVTDAAGRRVATEKQEMAAEAIPLDVLFEDDYLIVVNKPAGLVAHPTFRHQTGTLMNALLWRARQWPRPQRPSLVGRLDKLTSGIVLAAKTGAVHAALQRALATSAGEKDYLALVYGRVPVARGKIDLKLARDREDRRRIVASTTEGAASVTEFERLARVKAPGVGLALLRCRLMTGRTHQIRVHLSARGWPVVGDPTYGAPRWRQITDQVLAAALSALPRQALHASRLMFAHPLTGKRVRIEAPLPQDLTSLLELAGLSRGHMTL